MKAAHRLQLWLLMAACSALVVYFLWPPRSWGDAPLVAAELWVFSALTLEAGLTDFFSRRIPNLVLLVLGLLGLILGGLETYAGLPAKGITDAVTLMDRLIAMGASALLFSVIKLLFERFSPQQQLGWGDTKFLIALGATSQYRFCCSLDRGCERGDCEITTRRVHTSMSWVLVESCCNFLKSPVSQHNQLTNT